MWWKAPGLISNEPVGNGLVETAVRKLGKKAGVNIHIHTGSGEQEPHLPSEGEWNRDIRSMLVKQEAL